MFKFLEEWVVNNFWLEWFKVYKMDYGQEEVVVVYGYDFCSYFIIVIKIEGDDQGWVKVVYIVDVCWEKDGQG